MRSLIFLIACLISVVAFADTASLANQANEKSEVTGPKKSYVCNVMIPGEYTNYRTLSSVVKTYRDIQEVSAQRAVSESFIQLQADAARGDEKARLALDFFAQDQLDIVCNSL